MLIDESTQAAEPECLIPLVLGAKQVTAIIYYILRYAIHMEDTYCDVCARLSSLVITASLDLSLCARKLHGLDLLNPCLNVLYCWV